jgi:excisionase family DNA binding protein
MPGAAVTQDRRRTLSLAEAAAQLGLHRTTLRGAIDRGEVPAVRIGRRWLIARQVLDDLLAGRVTEPER